MSQAPNPTVSIITVNYKQHDCTAECIQRTVQAIERSGVPWEIIIIDNDSPDESYPRLRERFEEQSAVKVIRAVRNGGYGYGNNVGVGASSGDVLWFLNSDAYVAKLWDINRLLDLVKAPETGLVATASTDERGVAQPVGGGDASFVWFMLSTLRLGAMFRRNKNFQPAISYLAKSLHIRPFVRYLEAFGHDQGAEVKQTTLVTGASFLCRRTVFERLKGFDEHFFLYDEDIDLSVRSVRAGYQNYICRYAAIVHSGSKTVGQQPPEEIARIKKASRLYYADKHFVGWRREIIKGLTRVTYRWL